MPNKKSRHKRASGTTGRMHVRNPRKVDSVKALLERIPALALTRISDQAARQREWRTWLEANLAKPVVDHVSGVVERDRTLVVFTESAAWSARLRYAIPELEEKVRASHPQIERVEVRVMPRN
jgi:hypothetical protein